MAAYGYHSHWFVYVPGIEPYGLRYGRKVGRGTVRYDVAREHGTYDEKRGFRLLNGTIIQPGSWPRWEIRTKTANDAKEARPDAH